MCKKLIGKLLGAAEPPKPQVAAAPVDAVNKNEAEASVMNPDVVDATGGREASGRVRLGSERKRSSTAVGLSL